MDILSMVLLAAVQACVFFLAGCLILKCAGGSISFAKAYLFGFAGWLSLYEVIYLPCLFLNVKTHVMGWIVMGAAVCISAAALVAARREITACFAGLGDCLRRHGIFLLIPIGLTLYCCLWQAFYADISMDAVFYISETSTAVYTDTIAHYSAYTGAELSKFYVRYAFNGFPFYNAAVASISGVAPVIQARTVMPVLSMLAVIAAYFHMGQIFFARDKAWFADLFLLTAMVLLFAGSSLYLPGSFALARLYEGKAVLGNVMVPMLLLCGLDLWRDFDDRAALAGIFFACGASVCLAGTCVIMFAGVPAAILPGLCRSRSFRRWYTLLLGLIPVLCWAACYMAAKTGYLPMHIRG